jgi:hypothetical protein
LYVQSLLNTIAGLQEQLLLSNQQKMQTWSFQCFGIYGGGGGDNTLGFKNSSYYTDPAWPWLAVNYNFIAGVPYQWLEKKTNITQGVSEAYTNPLRNKVSIVTFSGTPITKIGRIRINFPESDKLDCAYMVNITWGNSQMTTLAGSGRPNAVNAYYKIDGVLFSKSSVNVGFVRVPWTQYIQDNNKAFVIPSQSFGSGVGDNTGGTPINYVSSVIQAYVYVEQGEIDPWIETNELADCYIGAVAELFVHAEVVRVPISSFLTV